MFDDLESAKDFLKCEDSTDAQIYRVNIDEDLHRGDMNWTNEIEDRIRRQEEDGEDLREPLDMLIEYYWAKQAVNNQPVWETLCRSAIVEEIVMNAAECEAHRVTQGWLETSRLEGGS